MHFVIAGGSGYVGSHLCRYLKEQQSQITVLTHSDVTVISNQFSQNLGFKKDAIQVLRYEDYHGEGDVLINLAGENLGAKKINLKRLQNIEASRMKVLEHFQQCSVLPKIFMQANGVACYPNLKDVQTESSPTCTDNDIGKLSLDIEERVKQLNAKFNFESYYNLRLGIVLSRDGGFIRKLKYIPPFKVVNGQNYIPFISMEDTVRSIYFLATSKVEAHTINLTSPEYATLNELLACCFKMSWLPTLPVLSSMLHVKDRRTQLIQADQKISPQVLLDNDFQFKMADISRI